MTKETLQCEICSAEWTRKRARGRKPKVCPQCIKDEVVLSFQETAYEPAHKTMTKTAKKWTCPRCNASVTVFVNLTYPPICTNPSSHSSKAVEMQIIGRQEKVA